MVNIYMSPEKKSKLELNSATIFQSTPKRRGRPRGIKNGKGKKIQVQKIKLHLGNKVRQRVKKVIMLPMWLMIRRIFLVKNLLLILGFMVDLEVKLAVHLL